MFLLELGAGFLLHRSPEANSARRRRLLHRAALLITGNPGIVTDSPEVRPAEYSLSGKAESAGVL